MFKRTKQVNGKKYHYVEHSFRVKESVKKFSFYAPKGKSLKDFKIINKDTIQRIVNFKINYIKNNQKTSKFFGYGEQLNKIEEKRAIFLVLSKFLTKSDRQEIMDEFLRTFLVNSMAMEGGTISYDVAKAIEEKRKVRLKGINKLDIPLYIQLKNAYSKLRKTHLRSPKQIKDLHKIIYSGIYPFAGEFRDKEVTFGDLKGLAFTVEPKNVRKEYKHALQKYYQNKGKIYDFERIIEFHKDLQRVHGFEDGNSRLSRLIMLNELLKLGYPPFLVRGTQSTAYRRSLVKAINGKDNTALLKFFYNAYNQTFDKFWLPVLEEKIKDKGLNF
jgi:fido (protein-threonine AMPylation protein)